MKNGSALQRQFGRRLTCIWPQERKVKYTKMKDPISQTRRLLYGLAKILGDVSAVQRGTVGKRIARRAAGKAAGGLLRRLFK